MKKLLVKLIRWREQRNPSKFHEQEAIERDLAEERRQQAMEHERERLRNETRTRQVPADEEIFGPSDSEKV